MSTLIKSQDVRTIALGINVSRATAALPAGVLGNIYTVSIGRIILVSLIGEVTTVLGAGANALTIGTAPTVGVGSVNCLATTVSILTAPVGTHFGANAGGALAVDLATQAGVALGPRFVVNPGAITISPSATVTGSVKWDLTYIPLDVGASVVAA